MWLHRRYYSSTDGNQVFLFVLIRGVVVWEHRDAAGSRRLPLATGLLQHDMVLLHICKTMLSMILGTICRLSGD